MTGQVYVVAVGQSEKMDNAPVDLVLSFYVGEPCRICGKPITREDIDNGAVFASYSDDDLSRSVHKECWEEREDKCK